MKNTFASVFVSVVMAAILLGINSCGKEKSTQPVIEFISGSRYISSDTSLLHGTVFNIGISAVKTGSEGLLSSCTIARSINGGADSTLQEMTFLTQTFIQVYNYKAADSGTVERYTFTVSKLDGYTNSVSLTVTDI